MPRLAALPAIALAAACLVPDPGGAQAPSKAAPSSDEIVACYDAASGVVVHVLAALCRGEVIDAAREAALAAERQRRIESAVRGAASDPVTGQQRLIGTGSGFYVTAADAVTNQHVVARCASVTVTSEGYPKLAATVAAADSRHDLALLRTAAPAPAVARFSATPIRTSGKDLAVVGYPAYGLPTIRSSLATASATTADLATTANEVVFAGTIRRGHSGSPLLDEAGNVLGVVRAKPDSVKIYQATKQLPPDLGVAISQSALLRFLGENGIRPLVAPAAPALPPEALHAKARGFVVQVGCWR